MPRSMGSEESESSESSSSESSSSESSSSESSSGEEELGCEGCHGTGYGWQASSDLVYCNCSKGVKKKMEKVVALEDISQVGLLPINRVACKV